MSDPRQLAEETLAVDAVSPYGELRVVALARALLAALDQADRFKAEVEEWKVTTEAAAKAREASAAALAEARIEMGRDSNALNAQARAVARAAAYEQALRELDELGPEGEDEGFDCGRHDELDHDHKVDPELLALLDARLGENE